MVRPASEDNDENELNELQEDEARLPQPFCLESTKSFFSENSPLRNAEEHGGRPYERRPQQTEMALEIARSLENGENLCVEAPTGVGKSFAYLVPSIYAALSMKKPVVITTETLNLQEQLVYKDLPILQEIMHADFKFVLAKGRNNYLCLRRLSMARGGSRDSFLGGEGFVSEVEMLARWSEKTEDGSRFDIDFHVSNELWSSVCSEGSSCLGPSCKMFMRCFYWKARRSWDKADIVVANHALFFVDLKMRALEMLENTLLPNYGAVIFDEAHTLEDSAADHLGLSLRSGEVKHFLNRLFNPVTARGLLTRPGKNTLALRAQVVKIHEESARFFTQFRDVLDETDSGTLRIRKPGRFTDTLSASFCALGRALKEYTDDETDEDYRAELLSQLERCQSIEEEIRAFINMELADHVYWAEGKTSKLTGAPMTELAASPLNIAAILRQILFSQKKSVILTSATLAVNGSLSYYYNRIGFANGSGFVLDSPFDYENQVKLYLPHNEMPLPSEETFNDAACDRIMDFLRLTGGRAFVLFTSYGMLKFCAERLESDLRDEGIQLLVHGENLSRTAMLNEFKKNERPSVIFGATSFWTGVDVPGEALSNVIITKLPFAVPSYPLIEARLEQIAENGGRPFEEYSVPDAILKFRQGVGRLIRSKTDNGIIVVLDRRIVTKGYGSRFLSSIPSCPSEYF